MDALHKRIADRIVDDAFKGRTGHGNKTPVVHRQMSRQELHGRIVLALEVLTELQTKTPRT